MNRYSSLRGAVVRYCLRPMARALLALGSIHLGLYVPYDFDADDPARYPEKW
ncbi:hypothetical protein [Streptomyces albipurpureus]|uniref:Uncharacterized protein n=1 Tax=Streptomyces albipurpureus TaxID=2897419 RepID=A0ABT0UGJ9_9ACTN|nr:hypothetical protein [Streptomyces sp. CWNU-1]MCM2387215.1 hypothetical protein [Streptomyces sp. CWNU-1]